VTNRVDIQVSTVKTDCMRRVIHLLRRSMYTYDVGWGQYFVKYVRQFLRRPAIPNSSSFHARYLLLYIPRQLAAILLPSTPPASELLGLDDDIFIPKASEISDIFHRGQSTCTHFLNEVMALPIQSH
jgi:hypothetical protein